MLRGALLLCAVPLVAGQGNGAMPITDATYSNRACRPGWDHFAFCNTSLTKGERVEALIDMLHDDEITPLLTARRQQGVPGPASNISRLGVPAYDWGLNCLHGVQASCVENTTSGEIFCPTSFPNPVGLGASWNKSMWQTMGAIIGWETRALWLAGGTEYANGSGRPHMGLDCWSPNINMNHDPRWGRNQEVPSEDPFFNGVYGSQVTKGQQWSDADSKHVMSIVTLKHWDAYTLEDSDLFTRHTFNAVVDNTTLADTFFTSWRMSVKDAGALGVMCSYNEVNGVPSCASPFLRDVLRNTFEFKGYQSSDSGALWDFFVEHNYVATEVEAACAGIKGWTDVDSGSVYHDSLLQGVQLGLCTMDDVKVALRNTLGLRFDMGLFDPAEDQPYWNVPPSIVGKPESIEAAKQATYETMVLLKNDKALPLSKGMKVAVVGPHYNTTRGMLGGSYYGQVCKDNTFNCIESIPDAVKRYSGAAVTTAQGCTIQGNSTAGFAQALALVHDADIVVLAMGIDYTVEAEAHDRVTIDLPGVQQRFISEVAKAAGSKPTVLTLMNGGMLALGNITQQVDAIVEAFYPSMYGADAIAATLFGSNDRLGGKMPYTVYPAGYVDTIRMEVMSMNDFTTPGRSYKYYAGPVETPFGFGLSLTTFHVELVSGQSSIACTNTQGLPVHVKVTNTGSVTGDEVIQIFRLEGTTGTGLPLIKKLVGFERVHLEPSQSASVTFVVTRDDFTDVEVNGDHVCKPATYHLLVTNGNEQHQEFPITTTGQAVTTAVFPMV